MKDFDTPNLFFRVDLLTGCSNLVSFSKSLDQNFENKTLAPLSLIAIDVYQLRDINRTKGFDYGDSILRWMGIAIKDETNATVYRIAGDGFVAALIGDSHEAHRHTAQKLFDRLNGEALQLELTMPVVRMALIHFPAGTPLNPSVVWRNLNEKLELINPANPFQVFHAETSEEDAATLHAIQLMARRIETLGGTLQYTFRLAYTDPVSKSPNMLAIQRKLDFALTQAMLVQSPLCVCLLDGDNLKQYNNKGYEAGDDVIRKLSVTLGSVMRPDDFLGRWRMGDEFIVILPDTTVEQAVAVAERLRSAVETASTEWLYPTSVSIGVAYYPKHGNSANELLEAAQRALTISKQSGKNRVTVAP
ncbi:MAG: diguanylate cyclase domain-containing protein [Byssovorax cruenta]|jgi:diguanylate cyclase (GGDEF)-like protein